ncbi:S8 family serine peptidase [Streptomyces sp. WZ.A104]|uniref:S8 family serine peptidase n=1 Tax=Streptomyces sp. WZ.A104 TaxID=2023771 RepID=UPI00211C1769|nr:S8 family serine peptidase [Streptomyces sp. WZ.A104]
MRLTGVLDPAHLSALTARTAGRPDVVVGVVDGAVDHTDPDLALQPVRFVGAPVPARDPGAPPGHGTLVVSLLAARPTAPTPGICPGCSFVVRPVLGVDVPPAAPADLADALADVVAAGARVVNLSLALERLPAAGPADDPGIGMLLNAVELARGHGVLVVAAAGNDGELGGPPLVRHPWVIPVVACDDAGRPLPTSTLGRAIGRHGLTAPALPRGLSGTSAAAPVVTGAVALLWSLFPGASAEAVRDAVTRPRPPARRTSVVPPLLDAAYAYDVLRDVSA